MPSWRPSIPWSTSSRPTRSAGPWRSSARARRGGDRDRADVRGRPGPLDKRGAFTGSNVVNPFTGDPVPLYVADYVLMGYGTGAIMAVPAEDERDWAFAQLHGLPIVRTVQPPDDWDAKAVAPTRARA